MVHKIQFKKSFGSLYKNLHCYISTDRVENIYQLIYCKISTLCWIRISISLNKLTEANNGDQIFSVTSTRWTVFRILKMSFHQGLSSKVYIFTSSTTHKKKKKKSLLPCYLPPCVPESRFISVAKAVLAMLML